MPYLSGYGIPAFSCSLQEPNDLFRAQWKNHGEGIPKWRPESGKALRWRLQSFALAVAKLCVGSCKALRWRLQSFALAVAKLCVGRCNALRRRVLTWSVQSWIREKGGMTHYTGHCSHRWMLYPYLTYPYFKIAFWVVIMAKKVLKITFYRKNV